MVKNEFYIESKFDGLPLSVLEIMPDGKPYAVVYMLHGLCGCKDRFIPFMEFLACNGLACVASDHRGHGCSVRSEDDRGYMYNGGAKAIVMDIDAVVEYIRHRFYGLHVIMIGHSMGSLAARAYLKYHDSGLEGLVICGSPSPNPLAPVGHFFLKLLCRIGGGRVRVGVLQKCISGRYNRRFRHEGPQAWTCSDPNVRMTNAQDPRCNFTLTADCSSTLMELFKEAYSDKGWCPKKPDMPVLFLSGEDDPCMISREKFVKAADLMIHNGYKRVSSRTYTGMRHEILNEVGRISVWRDILDHISELK